MIRRHRPRRAHAFPLAAATWLATSACHVAPGAAPLEHPPAPAPEAPATTLPEDLSAPPGPSPAVAVERPLADTGPAELAPEPPPAPLPAVPLPDATFREPITPRPTEERLSYRIANLSPAQCRAELAQRKLPVKREGRATPGVATPVRLTGNIGDVRFITPGKKSVYGIFDCRLVVLLDELVKVLASQEVTAVHVDNSYRPKAHLPGKRHKRSQHAYGLAIDIYGFTLRDGTTLVIERDFAGALRMPVCGPLATVPDDPKAILLRNVTCAIARSRLFNTLLTPSFDAAHADHLHADIQRGKRARVVR